MLNEMQGMTVSVSDTSSRVLYLGDPITLQLVVNNATSAPIDGKLTLNMKDFQGQPAGQAVKSVSLPAGSDRLVTLSPTVKEVGYFSLDVTVRSGNTTLFDRDAVWSLAVFEPGDDFPGNSPFGTHTIGNTVMLADIVPKGFYGNMVQAGAKWGTIDTWWSRIEPAKGDYDWSYYGQWFDAAVAAGITPIPHLFGIPRWISSQPERDNYWAYPPTDWGVWEEFVEKFVDRYKDWLVYLRIWNEANVGYWQGTPAQYGELVIHASQAAKRIKPDIKIIIDTVADSAQDVFPFLDAVHATGASPHWDVNGIHNYWLNNTNYPERTSFISTYEDFIDWNNTHNPTAEIWDTEFACMADDWGTWWKGVGETKQAQWLARAHVLGFSMGLDKMFWFPGYSWPDPTMAPYYNPAGLLRVDLSPRPAYVAYHTMAVALSRATFNSALTLGTDRFCRIFKTPEGCVTALWSVDAPHAGAVTLCFGPGEKVKRTTLMGKHKIMSADSITGAVTVDIDENLILLSSATAPASSPLSSNHEGLLVY